MRTRWRMKERRRKAFYNILNEIYEAVFPLVTDRNLYERNISYFFLVKEQDAGMS
jgi:hypothetical protein